jgi:Fe-S-cluster-containing dehydrogenase component
MKKNIFIFDQNKCVGCHACLVACVNENGFQANDQWRNVHHSNDTHFPHLPLFYLSLTCNHCDDAPCLKNCPALAYSRDEETGAVIHHPEKCIGCKYCTWACPYDAPKFNSKTGIIEKCTFCNSRILENLKPACANLCPVGALDFAQAEFTREESIESSPVPVHVGSNLKINTLRKETGPEIDFSLFNDQPDNIKPEKKQTKISAQEEWPLLIFTLLSTLLVVLYASEKTDQFNFTSKLIYLGFGALAALLSMLHLGKKTRAFRSMLNIKNSWLSREIITFSLFLGSLCIDFFFYDIPDILVIFFGITLLISIDMLYRLASWRWPLKIHSAQTLLIGISLFALLTNWYYMFVFTLSFRLTLYVYRKYEYGKEDWFHSILRIIFPISSAIAFYTSQEHIIMPIILLLLGEIIDRIDFYNELNVPEP